RSIACKPQSFVVLTHPPPSPTPFPYTTLFRSPREVLDPEALRVLRRPSLPPEGHLRFVESDGPCPARDHVGLGDRQDQRGPLREDRKSTRLNSSHVSISYAVFCLKKKII